MHLFYSVERYKQLIICSWQCFVVCRKNAYNWVWICHCLRSSRGSFQLLMIELFRRLITRYSLLPPLSLPQPLAFPFSWSNKPVSRVYFKLITDNLLRILWWTQMSEPGQHLLLPLQTFRRMRMVFISAHTGIMGYMKKC